MTCCKKKTLNNANNKNEAESQRPKRLVIDCSKAGNGLGEYIEEKGEEDIAA